MITAAQRFTLEEAQALRYHSWSKEDIYAAYLNKCEEVTALDKDIARIRLYSAGLEYDLRKSITVSRLDKIFKDGVDDVWLYSLIHGTTTFYDDDNKVLSWWVDVDGICYVNSASVDNKRFTRTMLQDIENLIYEYGDMEIESEVLSMKRYLGRYGFRYNELEQKYSRRV